MADLIDKPPIGLTLDEDLLEGYDTFPGRVYLIAMGGGKYACNNVTLSDAQVINGLSCFPSGDDATTYMGLLAGLSGEIVGKSFEEAREIAISKPILTALLLFRGGQIVDIHYIR